MITAIALFVGFQQHTVVPNQEIVLEFVDVDITSPEAQNTIAIVKKQLQSIGVKNPVLSKNVKDGKLTITYYSNEDVAYIKRILSKEQHQHLAFNHILFNQHEDENQPFPLREHQKDYKLNVYEIYQGSDIGLDFNNAYTIEVTNELDRYSGPVLYDVNTAVDLTVIHRLVNVARKVNTTIVISIDNTSYKIPEVRAGPIS
ncbi:hypothetical protein GCM10022393_04030 [Aquimarina addita]|uniref:Uncharacterized protein n=1 Tax=Aquimarina addita TaxID=870485 RepID=A0ABP7X9E6_9FLAO